MAIEIPTGEQYGIVVSKSNAGLTAAINEALAALKDDGTIESLEVKWFRLPAMPATPCRREVRFLPAFQ